MTYAIREGRETDLPFLAANLRGADAREVVATSGHPRVLESLQGSFSISEEVQVATSGEDRPMIIWGRCGFSPRAAVIWCVATPEILKYRKPFLMETRGILRRWFSEQPNIEFLFNFTHADNRTHHKWLRFMGALLLPPAPMGPLGEPFCPFLIRRENYV